MRDIALKGAKPPTGGNNIHVFFHKRGIYIKCFVCLCLVSRRDVLEHAIMHVAQGDGQFDTHGTVQGFMKVTVKEDVTVRTGWCTTSQNAGPR